ncbi:putative signal transduction protein [Candidatus Termititenax persephonae]|uniref:Signal transduction protein n=1 Tax=Candidatus Termititenax persephonae TaxID=2218525 RepID=A0A388THP8_9BACT|nr:putative signal transduction protein [Candidatus Termititenax persephonae]
MRKFLVILLISALGLTAAKPVSYFSPRRTAMGGAGVAVVDKENSYFYNPAHAAEIQQSWHLPALLLIPNSFAYSDNASIVFNKALHNDGDDNTVKTFRKIVPSQLGLGGSYSTGLVFTPHFTPSSNIGSFAVGGYGNAQMSAEILNRLSPRFDLMGRADGVVSLAYARTVPLEEWLPDPDNFIFKDLQAGVAIKNIYRTSLYNPNEDSEVLSLEVLNLLGEDATYSGLNARFGSGLGFDLGVQSRLNLFGATANIAVVLNNVATVIQGKQYGPNIFTSAKGLSELDEDEPWTEESRYKQKIPLTATLGLAVEASPFANPPLQPAPDTADDLPFFSQTFKYTYLVLNCVLPRAVYAADFDIISPEKSGLKRLHLGLEQAYLNDFLRLQLGLNQGYPTIGLAADLFGWYRLGGLYYTEELGAEAGQNPSSFYVLYSSWVF